MKPEIGKRYLITTSEWFFAPDGETYRAVHGTLTDVLTSEETLGVKTSRGSTNWYLCIGNLIVAGCQVHYAVRADTVNFEPATREWDHEDKLVVCPQPLTRIYNADA